MRLIIHARAVNGHYLWRKGKADSSYGFRSEARTVTTGARGGRGRGGGGKGGILAERKFRDEEETMMK